jgi:NAD+ diphosphatase
MNPANLFAGDYLDRRAPTRLSGDWLAEARADGLTRYLAMQGASALVRSGSGGSRIAWLAGDDPRVAATRDPERLMLLGWFAGQRCVLVELDPETATSGGDEAFVELRPLACDLKPDEAGVFAYARAMTLWRNSHRHCSRCGAVTVASRAGHTRQCTGCGHEIFPRIDPAIIVLVHADGHALLGRQASWAPNRYSTIAGFVEPGESLEDAVRREVAEETGVDVDTIEYDSSQPWPFPSSLMLGFNARGTYTAPTLHDGELEDARWFSRDELRAGAVLLPPRESISRRLIEQWLDSAV